MKQILIYLFIIFIIAFGLWYFDNVQAQQLTDADFAEVVETDVKSIDNRYLELEKIYTTEKIEMYIDSYGKYFYVVHGPNLEEK